MGASREEIAAELVKANKALKSAESHFNDLEKLEKVGYPALSPNMQS